MKFPLSQSFNVFFNSCFFSFQKYVESSLGWAGERGEDSSYDSECDDESAHRAASRTPSDTLAAEFAEYVTLATPQPNQVRRPSFVMRVQLFYS